MSRGILPHLLESDLRNMELGIHGHATPRVDKGNTGNKGNKGTSYRPSKNRNPITGGDMPQFRPQSTPARPGSRPEGVPALQLKEEEPPAPNVISQRLHTPDTGSTVSWGTDRTTSRTARNGNEHAKKAINGVQKKPSAWDKKPVPDDLAPPSVRQQELYKQIKQDMRPESRNGNIPQEVMDKKIAEIKDQQLTEIKKKYGDIQEDEELLKQMKKWTTQAYTGNQLYKKLDAEAVKDEKRKQNLIETVMVDQLSKIPMSDNDHGLGAPPLHQPGMARGAIRTLHESNIRTTGTASETLLAQRIRFSARVLSRNGHDALRELMGFFFGIDNSLTIYEYRQFGKTAKALPFLNRGTYSHIHPSKQGQPITLCDIYPGSTLLFLTKEQKSLPVSLSQNPIVTFRIVDVDTEAKDKILLKGVRPSDKFEVLERLHMPQTNDEMQDIVVLKDVQGFVRCKLKKRGIRTVTGLGLYFRELDKSGDGFIDKTEFRRALTRFHLPITEEKFDCLWNVIDINGDGVLDYGEFMRGVIGEMNEFRKSFVRKTFQRLDVTKKGSVTFTQIKKFYKASSHPRVKAGDCGEDEVINAFLQSLDFCQSKDEISYVEFEEYYEGLSIGIDSDEDFVNIITNAWGQ